MVSCKAGIFSHRTQRSLLGPQSFQDHQSLSNTSAPLIKSAFEAPHQKGSPWDGLRETPQALPSAALPSRWSFDLKVWKSLEPPLLRRPSKSAPLTDYRFLKPVSGTPRPPHPVLHIQKLFWSEISSPFSSSSKEKMRQEKMLDSFIGYS